MIQMGLTEYGTLSIINRQKEQTDIEKLTKEEYKEKIKRIPVKKGIRKTAPIVEINCSK